MSEQEIAKALKQLVTKNGAANTARLLRMTREAIATSWRVSHAEPERSHLRANGLLNSVRLQTRGPQNETKRSNPRQGERSKNETRLK
jgi:hypothetical protein